MSETPQGNAVRAAAGGSAVGVDAVPTADAPEPQIASVLQVLTELETTIAQARAVPMTGNCVVNREQMLVFVAALREAIPEQIEQADALQHEAATAVHIAYREAEGIIVKAKRAADELASREEVAQRAAVTARDIVGRAEAEAATLRREADQYVARTLGAFEDQLENLRQQAARGKEVVQERVRQAIAADQPSAPAPAQGPTGATGSLALSPQEKAAATGLPPEVFEDTQGLATYVKTESARHTAGRRAQW